VLLAPPDALAPPDEPAADVEVVAELDAVLVALLAAGVVDVVLLLLEPQALRPSISAATASVSRRVLGTGHISLLFESTDSWTPRGGASFPISGSTTSRRRSEAICRRRPSDDLEQLGLLDLRHLGLVVVLAAA
jgi:hypothetical protein